MYIIIYDTWYTTASFRYPTLSLWKVYMFVLCVDAHYHLFICSPPWRHGRYCDAWHFSECTGTWCASPLFCASPDRRGWTWCTSQSSCPGTIFFATFPLFLDGWYYDVKIFLCISKPVTSTAINIPSFSKTEFFLSHDASWRVICYYLRIYS